MIQPLTASLLVCLLAFTGIWLIQVRLRDAGIIDYYWGPGFFVIALVLGSLSGFTFPLMILTAMVALWSARLSWHLVARHRKSPAEDARYAAMRRAGGANFWWKSLYTIFLLQGVLQWIIASPLHAAFLLPQTGSATDVVFLFGLLLFVSGFAIESVADYQLAQFRDLAGSQGQLMTSGLWSRSRHPNYLGEIILWFGIGLCAFALTASFWAFVGPVILALIIYYVSIPITEDHLRSSRPTFDSYAARTPALVPHIPGLRKRASA
jgi:steroid 5-alpha reductase family enzyme